MLNYNKKYQMTVYRVNNSRVLYAQTLKQLNAYLPTYLPSGTLIQHELSYEKPKFYIIVYTKESTGFINQEAVTVQLAEYNEAKDEYIPVKRNKLAKKIFTILMKKADMAVMAQDIATVTSIKKANKILRILFGKKHINNYFTQECNETIVVTDRDGVTYNLWLAPSVLNCVHYDVGGYSKPV
jgi:hypothetical protein